MMTLEEAIKHCKDVALSCTNKECALEHFQLLKWLQEYSNMLEKQGEQKFADTDNKFIRMRETKPKDISEFLDRLTTVEQEFLWEHIEKVKKIDREEQKPTDKIEPKFHKGEWLCENEPNNYARFIQILEIVNVQGKDRYRISRDIHKDEDVVEFGFVEKYYHKFDIKDAKDGDVLFMDNGLSNCIFIYKSSNNGIINKYASYNKFGFESEHYLVLNDGYVIPATKEQRDTLMKAMKDAGYEFDFEKKELKKIEQKSAWSEEDECYLNTTIAYLKDAKEFKKTAENCINWLKFLRPQSQWKPSDEQMEALEHFIVYHNGSINYAKDLEELRLQLKKLREE